MTTVVSREQEFIVVYASVTSINQPKKTRPKEILLGDTQLEAIFGKRVQENYLYRLRKSKIGDIFYSDILRRRRISFWSQNPIAGGHSLTSRID